MNRDPTPCRDGDHGKFEMTERDGWARLGKLHTSTHILNTPCLLPVINPNIRTVEPRELWERYGFEALITNSYVIWKHDKLKSKALEDGDRVELRGFGAFSVRERKARIGRNPRTGEPVNVEAKRMPFFKMGKGMRERLNK